MAAGDGQTVAIGLPRAWRRVEGRIVYAGRPRRIVVVRRQAGYGVEVDGESLPDGLLRA
jgi:hypothetical protein